MSTLRTRCRCWHQQHTLAHLLRQHRPAGLSPDNNTSTPGVVYYSLIQDGPEARLGQEDKIKGDKDSVRGRAWIQRAEDAGVKQQMQTGSQGATPTLAAAPPLPSGMQNCSPACPPLPRTASGGSLHRRTLGHRRNGAATPLGAAATPSSWLQEGPHPVHQLSQCCSGLVLGQ